MPVSSVTEHWIRQDALTINLNHFGDPDYLQVSLLAGAVVMAFKQDVIGYNAAHNYRTWPLEAANTYLETTSSYHVYARLTRSEVNARALVVYDTILRDIEGRPITIEKGGEGETRSRFIDDIGIYEEKSSAEIEVFNSSSPFTSDNQEQEESEILGEPDPNHFYVYLGKISSSVDNFGYAIFRTWETEFRAGSLNTNQYQNEEGGGEWSKMFKWNKITDLIEVFKIFSSAIFQRISIKKGEVEKPIFDIKRSIDPDDEFLLDEKGDNILDKEGNPIKNPDFVPVNDETIPTTAWVKKNSGEDIFLRKDKDDRSKGVVASDKGFEVGRYVNGMIGGSGGKMYLDENGKSVLEIDKIAGREELIVPTITFNTIEVVSGDKANTFAYGRIKSVEINKDGTGGSASLDLLADEYGTLKPFDILRGVFHNIEGGNESETTEDRNGFFQYSGFFTSYFTPTEIVKNEAGEMVFNYSIQDGTTKHPCAGMNFYAYGNFIDEERQSITYENRDYKRRLVNMNTWGILPTKNIVMQDGKLDGLNIGGYTMSGYGTFQTNSYFTGVQIQFTPDQLSDLKGEDAYSVNLSSYEGLLKVDVDGNITSGMTSLSNVVAGSMNVTTRGENVVTTDFNLKTVIQAYRGSTPLFYSKEIGNGSFIASIRTVGCIGQVLNGTVVITEITDLSNCRVTVSVNCEGKYYVELDYNINAVYDGKVFNLETIYSKHQDPKKPADIHPYVDNEEWSHDISDENVFMAMSTKKDEEWSDWQVTRIKGFDGFDYKVYPENITIGKSLTGSLSPSSALFTCYRVGAGERVEAKADWRIQRYDGTTWVDTDFSASDVAEIRFDFPSSNEYKSYRFIAVPKEYNKVESMGTATILEDGTNGQMPRYRGVYKSDAEYVWNETYRDIVVYEGNAYQVRSIGDVVSGEFNIERWNQADKYDFVAMDTALINGAHIAGFTFEVTGYDTNGNPLGLLKSQNEAIVLDSKEGKAKISGDLYAGTLSFDRLSQDDEGSYVLPKINGRYGMMYVDNCIGISRSVQQKTYKTSGNDQIVRITGSSTVSNSTTTTINNQETIIFFSMYSDLIGNDVWTSVILPYWIYDGSGESIGGGGQIVFSEGVPPDWDKDVLYIIE